MISDTSETRGAVSDNCVFKTLSNSEKEFRQLDSLTRLRGLTNLHQQQNAASEDYFKGMVKEGKSPEILLFSTHGFYQVKPTFNTTSALMANIQPLCRSGIALASANYAWCEGKPIAQKEDGLLTAYEISNLDLSNTKLVTLAACKSGIGDLQGIEGVSGLQRAFKMAGVKNILVSLWDVDNEFSQVFVTAFYSRVLAGVAPRRAFEQTQADVIKTNKYSASIWGAFTLVE